MADICHGWKEGLTHLPFFSLCSSQALEEREQAQGENKWEGAMGTGDQQSTDPTSQLDWEAPACFDPLAAP